MKLIGIDVGGTFTDFVLFDSTSRQFWIDKRSTGTDTAQTIVDGLAALTSQAGIKPAGIDLLIHGTTVATNALLEFDGAEVGMITTRGFRDIVHIGRHQRPENYSIQLDIPWQAKPLVKRRNRKVVSERIIPPEGEILTPLDEQEVIAAAEDLRQRGIDSVAVCFLFSYLNPEHENRAAALVRETMPDAFVCTSSEVVPQFREFERFTTTSINAFVGPKVTQYIAGVTRKLAQVDLHSTLHVMQSNGGTATADVAEQRPVTLLLSGPVGGVMGGIWCSEREHEYLATLDVGGTSADVGIVTEQGLVGARSRDTWIAGYPMTVPMIDIETIGAGGGSIAHVDAANALHVGPRSAGSMPGPAAYGLGGTEPTVTDANVVLGRLPLELAGGLVLDCERAKRAVDTIADALGMPRFDAAAGILQIVNENMAAALRSKTVERGLDPREFLLCAFGGAGPLQATEVASILQIPRVLVPRHPGVTSAAGLLTSDLRYDVTQTYLNALRDIDPQQLERRFSAGELELRKRLADDGCTSEAIAIERAVDLRYQGQSYELKIPIAEAELSDASVERLTALFHDAHRNEFGHDFPEYEIEFVNVRLTGIGALPHLEHVDVSGGSVEAATCGKRDVGYVVDGAVKFLPTTLFAREHLPVGDELNGPALIQQTDSTTLIPPDCSFRRDGVDNVIITVP